MASRKEAHHGAEGAHHRTVDQEQRAQRLDAQDLEAAGKQQRMHVIAAAADTAAAKWSRLAGASPPERRRPVFEWHRLLFLCCRRVERFWQQHELAGDHSQIAEEEDEIDELEMPPRL